MIEPRGTELIARYRANYGLPTELPLTETQILDHWRLERRLTQELLASTPETRWDTFERCYTELYQGVPWLRVGSGKGSAKTGAEHALWSSLLGAPPSDVYEVGSGDGSLARYLAAHGYRCRATDITRERGDRREDGGVSWGQTDGVNLEAFESPASFDVVISDQVVEHLHPDDILRHLRSARRLLRAGGRIAFATPHRYTGPHDVSLVFNRDVAEGMHLREYTYRELTAILREAGFTEISVPLRIPISVNARLGGRPRPRPSRVYLWYLIAIERLLGLIPNRRTRRAIAKGLWVALFTDNIFLIARRPQS